MRRLTTLTLILVLFGLSGTAQTDNLKDLESQLQKATSDTIKVKLLLNIGNWYSAKKEFKNAIEYFEQAKVLAHRIGNKVSEASVYKNEGHAYYYSNKFVEAYANYIEGLKLFESLRDTLMIAQTLREIGMVYDVQDKANEAMKYYLKSLEMVQTTKDSLGWSNLLGSIAGNYLDQDSLDKALEYFKKTIVIDKARHDKLSVSYDYGNIALVYTAMRLYQEALSYNKLALQTRVELKDSATIFISMLNIGLVYYTMNNFDKAISYIDSSIVIMKQLKQINYRKEAYNILSQVYSEMGDFKQAYKCHVLYSDMKDSILTSESSKQMAEMATKYETEKKETENKILTQKTQIDALSISKQQKDIKQQQIVIFYSAAGIILLVFLAFLLFRGNKIKQKANVLLSVQRDKIAMKKQEITDSILYGQKIQEAVLPPRSLQQKLFPESFVFFKPKDIVSGDFYWFGQKDNRRIIAVADCTGHGVPGAFMSMLGNAYLHEIVHNKGIIQPAKILDILRQYIVEALNKGGTEGRRDGMDISLLSFNKDNSMVEYAGAYNPLIYIRKGEVNMISADRQPIGYMEYKGNPFTNHELNLTHGDSLYLLSDGFSDQFGGKNVVSSKPCGKKLKLKVLLRELGAIQHFDMSKQQQHLKNYFNDWKGDLEQTDDVCLIGIRV